MDKYQIINEENDTNKRNNYIHIKSTNERLTKREALFKLTA